MIKREMKEIQGIYKKLYKKISETDDETSRIIMGNLIKKLKHSNLSDMIDFGGLFNIFIKNIQRSSLTDIDTKLVICILENDKLDHSTTDFHAFITKIMNIASLDFNHNCYRILGSLFENLKYNSRLWFKEFFPKVLSELNGLFVRND